MSFIGVSGASYAFDINQRENEYKVQTLNQQDLDRNFCLATTNLFKWMQAARMDLPWMQAGYRALGEVEPKTTRRVLVGSQMIKLVKPGALAEAVDNTVTVKVDIGDIGRTTIEYRYKIFFGSHYVASGSTVMIMTAGTPGNLKPAPVPDDVKALGASGESETNKFMKDALAGVPKEPPADAYTTRLIVRYSDEDVNKHANHSAQARYFEDAKEILRFDEGAPPALRAIAGQQLEAIVITYNAEIHAKDELEVKVSTGATGTLNVWVNRTSPNPVRVTRGCMVCSGDIENTDEKRLNTSKL